MLLLSVLKVFLLVFLFCFYTVVLLSFFLSIAGTRLRWLMIMYRFLYGRMNVCMCVQCVCVCMYVCMCVLSVFLYNLSFNSRFTLNSILY